MEFIVYYCINDKMVAAPAAARLASKVDWMNQELL
jgi:hypothetical protein